MRYAQIDPAGEVFPYVFAMQTGAFTSGAGRVREDVRRWCTEQFGGGGRRWKKTRYRITSTRAKFMLEEDAFAFKMRWC